MKTLFLILLALVLSLSPYPVFSQRCPDCEIVVAREQQYDQLLQLTATQRAEAEALHLPWGRPVPPAGASNERMLHQLEYLIWYDDDLFTLVWTAHRLSSEDAAAERDRVECFRRDLRLVDDVASICEDYEEPLFDRGHMVPSGDMRRSEAAMINTYVLSNMAPQLPGFNRGIWARLEDRVRDWAQVRGEVFIITGSIFDRDGDGTRDADEDAFRVGPLGYVAIPTHFYKIVMHREASGFINTITILIPHRSSFPSNTNNYLRQRIRTIDQIEVLTGIDFFPDLPPQVENAVESFRAQNLWPTQ